MVANRSEVIRLVKLKLELDVLVATQDELIELYVDAVGQHIRTYINASIVPDGLLYTWVAMAAAALSAEQSAILYPEPEYEEEFKISVGDTSVEPIKPIASSPAKPGLIVDKLMYDYRSDLNAYRKLRW